MGGRADREALGEREAWIMEVSSERLSMYERMLTSAGAGHRVTGESRGDGGAYFRELIARERERRAGALF